MLDANVEAKKTKRKKRDKREKEKKRRRVHVKPVIQNEEESGEDTEIYVSDDDVKPKDNQVKHKKEDNLLPKLKRQDAMYPEQLKAYLQSTYKKDMYSIE